VEGTQHFTVPMFPSSSSSSSSPLLPLQKLVALLLRGREDFKDRLHYWKHKYETLGTFTCHGVNVVNCVAPITKKKSVPSGRDQLIQCYKGELTKQFYLTKRLPWRTKKNTSCWRIPLNPLPPTKLSSPMNVSSLPTTPCPHFLEAYQRAAKATQRCHACGRNFFGDTCFAAHQITY